MRVIAGTARSLPLRTVEGLDTRPTTDRIKETLFNMLQSCLLDCRFLDLFAGSGSIGIEALSRGAKEAVFVENNRKAYDCIRENLTFTRLADKAQVHCEDALNVLHKLEGGPAFDLIFLDPPYRFDYGKKALEKIAQKGLLSENGVAMYECDRPFEGEIEGLEKYDERKYGKAYLTFFKRG